MRNVVERRRGGSMRELVALLALGFIVTLGVVVGTRMSSDAIAVLVGVIAGVAASIPCALLLMAVTRRRDRKVSVRYQDRQYRDHVDPHRTAPPIVIVTPGNAAPQQLPYARSFPYHDTHPQQQPRRQFRVMGYQEPETQPTDDSAATTAWQFQDFMPRD